MHLGSRLPKIFLNVLLTAGYTIPKVDMNDNELGILELIHLFVEVLDGYFGNVCELDLVFHFDKVRIKNRIQLKNYVESHSRSK